MRRRFLVFAALLSCCCFKADQRSTGRPFLLDPSKPFVIELGRGSGLRGLDIVQIRQTGQVTFHRLNRRARGGAFETATMNLSNADIARIVGFVNANRLTGLSPIHSDPNIADGTQWVLWIEQPPASKAIYFDNNFPNPIVRFAGELDSILQASGAVRVTWSSIPSQQGTKVQSELWAHVDQH